MWLMNLADEALECDDWRSTHVLCTIQAMMYVLVCMVSYSSLLMKSSFYDQFCSKIQGTLVG